MIASYYQNIFMSKARGDFRIVQEVLDPLITTEQNQRLMRTPEADEIFAAIKSIHPNKAPRPDRFSAGFFHTYWPIIGRYVVIEIQQFFTSDSFPLRQNEKIPKVTGPRKVDDYRLLPCAMFSTRLWQSS